MKIKFTNKFLLKREKLLQIIMRASLFLCFTTAFSFAPSKILSQNAKIKIDTDITISVANIFELIQQQADYKFVYSDDLIVSTPKVTLKKGIILAKELLKRVLSPIGCTFEFTDNETVIVKRKNKIVLITEQQKEIKGTVKDKNGEPLPSTNIIEKGTANGVITDFDGKFTLKVTDENAVLVVSYLGYVTQEVAVGQQTVFSITLIEDTSSLGEIVFVGYGSVAKKDLTGAISTIKPDDLTPGTNVSVEQALQGRVAGVQISQKSGQPGSAMAISIRGASSIDAGNNPLYVIDGVPYNNSTPVTGSGAGFVGNQNPRNPLNSLNPEDIKSIQILKDASSTAIYGARGSNGVVLITTKNGNAGKMKVNYHSYLGVQTVANKIELLSPAQYRDVLNDIIDDGGGSENQRVSEIQGLGTDWQEELYRNATIQNHNIAISGGSENASYYTSFNYFNQDGVVRESGIKRYNVRANIELKEDKKYSFGINLNLSYIFDDFVSNGVGINENAGSVYSAINYDPTITVYDADGNLQQSPFVGPQIDNPVALLNGEKSTSNSFKTFGNAYGEYFLFPTLSVKARIGADVNNSRKDVFIYPTTIEGAGAGSIATILTGRTDYYLTEGILSYTENFEDSNINALLGTTYEYFGTTSFVGSARGFSLPDLTTNAIGGGNPELNGVGSGKSEVVFISYLGRINYSLNDKYLFTASIRADGSSKFGPSNKWGYFPSAAIAWKVHNEPFLEDETISELKLRASYGSIGNANIANYLFLATFNTGRSLVLSDERFITISPSRIPNPDLKWESANQLDVGVDFGLFNNRLTGTLDYYSRKTEDLLLNVPKPSNTGFSSQVENIGSMENYGFEFSLNGRIISNDNFSWDSNFNLTTITNKVLDIGKVEQIIRGGLGFVRDATITRPGDPLNSYYGYIVDGVWQTGDDFSVTTDNVAPGDTKYRDLNGDLTINGDDRTIIGKPFPDYTWGWTNTFKYKNVRLSVFIDGTEGISTLNNNLVDNYFPINFRRNRFAEPYLNRWTPNNPTNKYPSFVNPTAQGQTSVNTNTVEDASYIRLQSVKLSYDVPVDKLNFFNRLTIYATGQNLFTITDYSGVDPAANAVGNNNLRIDYNTYPFSTTYSLGLNVEF